MNRRFIRGLLIAAGIIVVILAVILGPQIFTHKKPIGPAMATVARRSFPVVQTASGTVLPQGLENVNFSMSGQVKEIDVQLGQPVNSGQQLAKLDDSQQLLEVQAAQASVSAAQAARAACLTAAQCAAADAQYSAALVELARAQADLAKTILVAPAPGTVLEINGQVGGSVQSGSSGASTRNGSNGPIELPPSAGGQNAFIVLGSGTNLEVTAAFSETAATVLKADQTGAITFDAIPGISLPCKVLSVALTSDTINGVNEYYVGIALTGSDARLRFGMSSNVSIDVAYADNVLAVPNQALYSLDNTPHVDVWFTDHRVPTAVTTGKIGQQLTEITSGLTEGQQVVLSGTQASPTPSPS